MRKLLLSVASIALLSSYSFADEVLLASTSSTIPTPVTATSYTAGALLLGNGSSAINVLADTTSGQCLQSNGSGANPVWGSCSTGGGSPGGSSGQLQYNNSGSFGGLSTFTVGSAGNLTNSAPASSSNGPTEAITGTYTASTTPDWYISPGNLGVTAFSASGTMIGVNAASGYAGNLIDLQVNSGTSAFKVTAAGAVTANGTVTGTGYNATGTGVTYQKSGYPVIEAKPSVTGSNTIFGGTAPTPVGNSSAAFSVTVAASPTTTSGTLTFANGALNGWACSATDQTHPGFTIAQTTGGTSTTAVFQSYTVGTTTAAAPSASDVITFVCLGY